MISKRILLVFGLFCMSSSLIQGSPTEDADEYEYVEDGEDGKSEGPPLITTVPKQIDVVEGDDIRLECKGHHFDHYGLIWSKLPGKIISNDGDITVGKNDSARFENVEKPTILLIKNAVPSDAGSYECKIAYLQANVAIVHNVTVRARDMRGMGPYITLNPAALVTVDQDNSLNLTCTVRTEGKLVEFYWKRKNEEGVFNNVRQEDTLQTRPSATTLENRLMIKSVSRHDAGEYYCIFRDDLGMAEGNVKVSVRFSPVIETGHDIIHAGIGKQAELKCVARGVPHPTLTWYKTDRNNKSKLVQISQGQRYQLRTDHHTHYLFITSVTQNDFGTYKCEARNGFPKVGAADIEVVGTPSQPMLVESKTKLGVEHMTYNLVWEVESSIPIETNALRYRKEPNPDWTDIFVEGKQIPNRPSFYEVAYTLQNLTSSSTYEATLQSKNNFGWSTEARIHRFSINGKSYTDTMELSDDKGGKAPLRGVNSLLISASIFLFHLGHRW